MSTLFDEPTNNSSTELKTKSKEGHIMNVINLDAVRLQHQKECSNRLVVRIARALLSTYAVSPHLNLAAMLGYDPALSNQDALCRYIKEQMRLVDPQLAQAVFNVMCDRFQHLLTRLPSHQHGGL